MTTTRANRLADRSDIRAHRWHSLAGRPLAYTGDVVEYA
ncbi:hypothetical protein M8PIadj_0548 [Bifidobacterium animalis]|uniref:Uncharacterized protein n=1 Tax=Bifidobacterium animalis subsp. lactis CNCM I-2494 TaxID=1042403 RepID=A0A806FUI4_BIFAN|nr:hypothetical protein BALAC2494_02014 [Bifidobacterium animalis subsp. lactis CNCM I-2494]AFJ16273.1 hypothetical protein W7Y_0534 [Bifidobacterium animalis subsp. lactis B420]AFJ17850.1 hypothetical protein W91_0552 [Bifidobacterium animalis subsp. lactis Bi-07]AJD33650.1 hypothetical protein BAA6_0537 [Bifidobacterium animalis]QIR80566.1 hypothetical protein M8PIadj_0548 [Bifidobacterium animalis]